ncbi:acetylxylan esterase [Prosthecobacter sp.]|uniref:alpha/beta hydrolase n=1 Tax=Prosthecobacter sp. TaxID=1965333 RepID=UPI002489A7E9|nr:acetylxylan esterase [Prosthecobacter sp.]MDI1314535.1 acetylxylan esterase [Prosthecobacter sp.]
MKRHVPSHLIALGLLAITHAGAQDLSIYGSVSQDARAISRASLAQPMTPEEWQGTLAERRGKWLEMLGLSPLPERTPLQATVTGVLERGDYVVEKIHFQSSPGAHVAGNLYRPAKITGRLPAVLYLCGHSKGKVNGPYQANPRWFAQHGYVALVLDPVQLGECQGMHHGTYRDGRFDWPSRGYTPAGTEVWNAMRALDYLQSRPDVEGEKMGVTGLSGGGAMSWFLGAADERVKVVVPVCQSGSIERMAVDRATDGHCDCAFWVNYYRWCWPDIGALIAPRAFLIASGSEDVLWRPAGYRDVALRIRHQYTALNVPKQFDLVEDLAPHGYTPKLRQAIFTFFNTHLKNDPTPVQDDVTDFVEPAENLLVFGGKLPQNDTMMQMDARLVKAAEVSMPDSETQWQSHQKDALTKLRQTTFRNVPADPTPRLRDQFADGGTRDGDVYGTRVFDTADGLTLAVKTRHLQPRSGSVPTVVFAVQPEARSTFTGGGVSRPALAPEFTSAGVEVRNTGATSVGPGYLWTLRRVYPLLGHTLPERQVNDLLAGAALMRKGTTTGPLVLYGKGDTAALAIYAAILDPQISELILEAPPESHTQPTAAEFAGILRIGDLPQNLALLHPRRITFIGKIPPAFEWTREVYEKLGTGDRIRVIRNARDWKP